MTHTKTYKNGLRLILEQNGKSVISANIAFNVGSQNETKDEEGFSHFIEHMIFKGTKRLSAEEVMDKLTFLGADYNAFTSKIVTKFIFKCLAENFEECFKIYSELLLNAEFAEEELNKERQVVIEEMKRCEDEPVEVMYRRAMENYFSGHSIAHDELGNEKLIEKVTREQLLGYKNKYYRAENCVISIAGNIDFEILDRIVEEYFSGYFMYNHEPNKIDFEPYKINISKCYDIIERPDNQANVCLVIKSVATGDKLKFVADLYTSILGNSQNSRLFKKIREELGFVYSIYAFNEIVPKAGEILICFGTRPKNVKKAMIEIKKIIEELATAGVSEEELTRAKNWKKSCIAYGTETNSDIAEINGTILNLYNKVFNKDERAFQTESVSIEEVNAFAKRIASEKTFNIVAVGKNLKIDELKVF